ncbi:DUF2167 domain-containing protein [Parvularcula lutaonensis]|uniref:DUF2167 domain-containing protein n=1 Tax=Parvularcula lutaonensis TaxID=491923 RepID=A0ABV7MBZ7_9PROT|nr:DUF2167 domain-containing protein [Parvularcula lutaonensis]GGY39954.1 hypothetical protein GCM10007148_05490 [Parvularcula lutaonensis]
MKKFIILGAFMAAPLCAHAQEAQETQADLEPAVELAAELSNPNILRPGAAELYEGYSWLTEPKELQRGSLTPTSSFSIDASRDAICDTTENDWGWQPGSCRIIDAMILQPTEAIDTLIIEKPNSDGYVTFDDWEAADREKQINQIWDDMVEGLKGQSANLGIEITADDWFVYPTLNRDKAYLYYATRMDWAGDPVINVEATRFDRRGYVKFSLVPFNDDISAEEIERELETILTAYEPNAEQSYADFEEGDKVAAAGAVGVLAALAGVKFAKSAGLLGAALLLLKKFWFVLLAPFAFLRRLFSGKKED